MKLVQLPDAMLTSFATSSIVPQRSSLGRMVNQGTVLLMVSIGTIILVLALLILFHQNANATKGYILRTLERERSELLLQEEVLNMQLAEAQALEQLQQDKQIQAMAGVRGPTYTEDDSTVAQSDTPLDESL